jgi:RNA polymerase sigma-B factor
MSRPDLHEVFVEYRHSGDPELRDRLVAANLGLARQLARRFAHRGIPLEDLEQVACYGLVLAVDRFEPERGLEFSTYATPTIAGELKRHFRDKGWSVRVPRRIQELHLRLNTLVNELSVALGRSPTIAELAAAANASEEDVLEAMEASVAYRSDSIDDGERAADGDALFDAEDRVLLESLIATLAPREQLLVRLRFYEDMTQAQIAARLGISQMHVSRLLARCLDELRRRAELTDG